MAARSWSRIRLAVAFAAGVVVAGTGVGIAAPGGGDPSAETTEWLKIKVGDAMGTDGTIAWVPSGSFGTSAEVRVPRYPFSIEGKDVKDLTLDAVRGEQVSAQLAVASGQRLDDVRATVGELRGPGGAKLGAPRLRFVKYVPVMRSKTEYDWSAKIDDVASSREVSGDRNPDVVGDPLEERGSVGVPAHAAQPLWFTFQVPSDAAPGTYTGTVQVTADGKTVASYPLSMRVGAATVPPPDKYRFFLDVWAQPETIARQHGVPMWSPSHWRLIEAYQRDLHARGQKVINTTIVDDPWQHPWSLGRRKAQTYQPYGSMVGWSYDGKKFGFDFARFDKYVETARRAGIGPDIGAFSMLAFQDAEHLTYTDTRSGKVVREDVELGGTRWREAWGAFLKDFQAHLTQRGWLEHTWLSFDERPLNTMTVVRDFVHEQAPVFDKRISIAGSNTTEKLAQNLSVDWGGIDALTPEKVEQRRKEGKITTFYTYGVPAHPNNFTYSPAVESRMLPWISAQRHMDGYLRWAYNSWPRDPFQEPVFLFTQGDEYQVYPGKDGPMSSVRWEQLKEGIEDFELVAQVREKHGETDGLKRALDLAVRDLDGRKKNVADMTEARRIVVEELTR